MPYSRSAWPRPGSLWPCSIKGPEDGGATDITDSLWTLLQKTFGGDGEEETGEAAAGEEEAEVEMVVVEAARSSAC
jgi:hypothetical protein